MDVSLQRVGRCLIVAPRGPLVAGRAAEDFERAFQDVIKHDYAHIVIDLASVPSADSAGIRSLVRAHTTAQRRGLLLRVARPSAAVRELLTLSRLDAVMHVFDSLDAAQAHAWPWRAMAFATGASVFCAALVWGGIQWPSALAGLPVPSGGEAFPGAGTEVVPTSDAGSPLLRPFLVVVKLIASALIGVIVTAVHRPAGSSRGNRAMEHAQILLCVSGAMMMIIIGDSLARAFGIAGAASIIRFRTPVDDPKDVTVLFLLMGLGMAIGLGAFAAAGLGTLFLCGFLVVLARAARQQVRHMTLEITADGRTLPVAHIQAVLSRNDVTVDPREVEQGEEESVVKYSALVQPEAALEELTAQLIGDGTKGVKSVSWEAPKKG